MSAQYDKVIIKEVGGEKEVAVIFDEKLHIPVFYYLNKCNMDDVLELLNKKMTKEIEK